MLKSPIPSNERERLEALQRYDLIESPPDEDLDLVTNLLSQSLKMPMAFVGLVDERHSWFSARVGLDATEAPREVAFCAHAIAANAPLIINDTLTDERFVDNPFVAEAPHVRFYAGYPLRSTDGYPLGTLCAMDRVPRELTAEQKTIMESLARVVETNLRLRYRLGPIDRSRQFRSFVEMAIHDLKNPLSVISSVISIIKDNPRIVAEDEKYLKHLMDAAHTLDSRLVSVLDMVSDMDGDGMKLEPNKVSPPELLRKVLKTTSSSAVSRDITVQCDVAEDCGDMVADAGVLERLLENLIVNALKFSSRADSIWVDVRRSEAQWMDFRVTDNGPGVPEADRVAIFEPFNRGSSKPSRGSVGLGLAFCKIAAQSHGGTIWVEDSPQGKGAQFCVRLPIEAA